MGFADGTRIPLGLGLGPDLGDIHDDHHHKGYTLDWLTDVLQN